MKGDMRDAVRSRQDKSSIYRNGSRLRAKINNDRV